MGLDMYAFRCDPRMLRSPTERINEGDAPADLVEQLGVKTKQIAYWRKHHDLHGWMEKLYREKGGDGEFNCEIVQLTAEDLDRLDTDITYRRLPSTTGFFFGNNPPSEESDNADLEFIARAREAIADGDAVYYDSWW